ncbi:hypothetical protein ACFU5L_13715, partial [Streptomyces sp. NPDC057509]
MNTTPASPLTPALRAKLASVPVAGLSAQLRRRGLEGVFIDGVRPLVAGQKFVGTARTLRFVPFREDLFRSHGGGYNAQKRTFDSVAEGEVDPPRPPHRYPGSSPLPPLTARSASAASVARSSG